MKSLKLAHMVHLKERCSKCKESIKETLKEEVLHLYLRVPILISDDRGFKDVKDVKDWLEAFKAAKTEQHIEDPYSKDLEYNGYTIPDLL